MARKAKSVTDDVLRELRSFGLAYPGSHTKSPWPGHLDLAVKDKTFAYLSLEGEPLRISCKLPRSSGVALMLPFCTPTAYGLGKSGWVSADFAEHPPDVDMLKAWIDESYRAQAPKTLVKQIGTAGSEKPEAKEPAAKPTTKKPAAKPTTKKPAANKPTTPAANKPAAKQPASKASVGKPIRKAPNKKRSSG